MIAELGQDRVEAELRASALGDLLGDLEALHEPDADGDCPACMAPGPCLTLLLIRRDITVEQAFAVIRGAEVIDLTRAERDVPRVPSLSQLLAQPSRGMDRFFDALLGLPHRGDEEMSASPDPGAARAS
jgi:hypothetical protein